MPANMPAPVLCWKTNLAGIDNWVVGCKAGGHKWLFFQVQPMWRPPQEQWRRMRQAAGPAQLELVLGGYRASHRGHLEARGSVRFSFDPQPVAYPLFYREVNLPFIDAVKDPTKIRWRFGSLDKGTLPPAVLENLPVCGNCHSFSQKGELLAMDVDYANDKAAYIITRTAPEMRLATSDIITWDDYRRQDGQQTFGLLSQISPDGRYVLSTVKDRSVFMPKPELAFSQLFFPLKGIIVCYDRVTKQFSALPGADDPAFVQSNPTWSPDGQHVVFARSPAAHLDKLHDKGGIMLSVEEVEELRKQTTGFRYDLYRVPFNGGKGGQAQPLRGASANGRSNYFPKYSPDGRWIVFCQASNYMLLQPDSQLYIIPAEGGQARALGCNLVRMNSWHSWSPDGRWLVFSSKTHSDYTQLYLTRINEQGAASPPVWLAHMVAPQRAANIPEFVDLPPDAIGKIREQFLDDYSYFRAGDNLLVNGDTDGAMAKYRKALSLNANNAAARQRLGLLLYRTKHQLQEALQQSQAAVRLEPRDAFARHDLGLELADSGDLSNAVVHLAEAVRLLPNGYDRPGTEYNVVDLNYSLAEACFRLGNYAQSISALETVLRHNEHHGRANYLMALAQGCLGETESTVPYLEAALQAEPSLAQQPQYYDVISRNFTARGNYEQGLKFSEKAYQLAMAAGRADDAAKLRQRAEYCRRFLGTSSR